MSLQDPISDMLTRIRNANAVNKKSVAMPWSKIKQNIADLLVDEGYAVSAEKVAVEDTTHYNLVIVLKYHQGKPVIDKLQRVSRPGLRVYKGKNDLPSVDSGLGIAVISTPNGLLSNHHARQVGVGGEVLFYVS